MKYRDEWVLDSSYYNGYETGHFTIDDTLIHAVVNDNSDGFGMIRAFDGDWMIINGPGGKRIVSLFDGEWCEDPWSEALEEELGYENELKDRNSVDEDGPRKIYRRK